MFAQFNTTDDSAIGTKKGRRGTSSTKQTEPQNSARRGLSRTEMTLVPGSVNGAPVGMSAPQLSGTGRDSGVPNLSSKLHEEENQVQSLRQ